MTWQLALSNLSSIAPDTRQKCKECGCPVERLVAGQVTVYCSDGCKEEGQRRYARERKAAKKKVLKPSEQCHPNAVHARDRKAYWKEVFGTGRSV